MDIADLYRKELLEHYHNPQNRGRIENADVHYKDFNPVCGDEVEIFATINDGKIKDSKFEGKGCAISQASASILTDFLKDKTVKEIRSMGNEKMLSMMPVTVSHLRIKCALLILKAVQKGIFMYERGKNGTRG